MPSFPYRFVRRTANGDGSGSIAPYSDLRTSVQSGKTMDQAESSIRLNRSKVISLDFLAHRYTIINALGVFPNELAAWDRRTPRSYPSITDQD